MVSILQLRRATRDALAFLRTQGDVREAEVFAAANTNLIVRLNYTSHIPSNGVEEPKSVESYGLGIRVALDAPEGVKTGFGSEPGDLSAEGARRALQKARRGAALDPEFVCLPRPTGEKRLRRSYHDPRIMRVGDGRMVQAGWETVRRALEVFTSSEELLSIAESPEKLKDLGLIVGGDVIFLQERVAVGSYALPRIETDQSTLALSLVTAMVERESSKGTGYTASPRLEELTGEAGVEAARTAIGGMGGRRVPGGAYRVVLGPQAMAEILDWILVPSLRLDILYASASTFLGKLRKQVASEKLSLYDHGAVPGLAATKAITDEGLPTGRTDLIRRGVLTGFLANHYEYQRMLRNPRGRDKLGVEPCQARSALAPHNGFRVGGGGGRHFDAIPSIAATNLIVATPEEHTGDDLLRTVGQGLYIGRIWYTYPMNGYAAGDFSGTVVGDSYVIEDGRLVTPLKANTLRINDNIHNLLTHILAIGGRRRGVVRWASDQVTWTPEVAVENLHLEEIGGYMDSVYGP